MVKILSIFVAFLDNINFTHPDLPHIDPNVNDMFLQVLHYAYCIYFSVPKVILLQAAEFIS